MPMISQRSKPPGRIRFSLAPLRPPRMAATAITGTYFQTIRPVHRNTSTDTPLIAAASTVLTALIRWTSPRPIKLSALIIRMPMPAPK